MKLLALGIIFLILCKGNAQQQKDFNPNTYRFSYKSEVYKGTRVEITSKLRALKNNSWFVNIPEEKKTVLNILFKKAKEQPIPKLYKKQAIAFLDALYAYEEFLKIYDNALYEVILNLKQDMRRLDFKFERQFTKAKIALERANKEDKNNTQKIDLITKELLDSQIKLICHRWMKNKMEKYKGMDAVKNPDILIAEFKKEEAMHVFTMIEKKRIEQISAYLENQIIDFFYNKSLPEIDIEDLQLDYIDKL